MTSEADAISISIIVPMLNEVRQLPDLMDHLLRWKRRGCEILLVDGGSCDGSDLLAECVGFAVINAPRGRARQMNSGASRACGDVLLFLHADTRLPDDMIAQVQRSIANGYSWGRFDVNISGHARMLSVIGWMMNFRSRFTSIATGDQAMFVRKTAFEAMGGFADLPLMEDIELSQRLKQRWRPACVSAKVTTSGRRWEVRGVWRTIFLMWRLRWAYWRGVAPEMLAKEYR
ncbi:MAG: TIGR04283 family arsenosugar biosynthesis glycosyltransferase [Steroidobacteraceae bacterium]